MFTNAIPTNKQNNYYISTGTDESLLYWILGDYVMAIGEFTGNTDMPTLLTQKLKIMKENQQELAAFWPLEVQHQLKYSKNSKLSR